jgi:putative membrane protein
VAWFLLFKGQTKIITMRTYKLITLVALFIGSYISSGCNSNKSSQTSGTDTTANVTNDKEAEKRNDAKFNKDNEDNAQFVVDAENINLEEINLGQLAESRGTSADVKDLGSMMNKDHKKAYDELATLAAKKNISVPASLSDKAKSNYDKLNGKNGSDFDKEFADMMVDGHKDAISRFEKATKDVTDSDIQAWASNMLPALRSHLDHSMTVQEKLKNGKAAATKTNMKK